MPALAFVITLVINTIAHELSHAAVADLVGFRLRRILIGRGPVIWRRQFDECELQVRALSISGRVEFIPGLRHRRLAMFAVAAAGPAATAVLLGMVIAIGERMTSTDLGNVTILPAVFALSMSLLFNLWPHRVGVDGAMVANDGLQMWQAVSGTRQPTSYRQAFDAMLAAYLKPGEQLPPISEASDEVAWRMYQHNQSDKTFAEIRILLEDLLSYDLATCERLVILDGLVTAGLTKYDGGLDADLDRWSAEAYSLAPDIVTLRGSRGSVLIVIGRVAEGLEVLKSAENGTVFNDTLVHAFRALGFFKLGQEAQAADEFTRLRGQFQRDQWLGSDGLRIIERIADLIRFDIALLASEWPTTASETALAGTAST